MSVRKCSLAFFFVLFLVLVVPTTYPVTGNDGGSSDRATPFFSAVMLATVVPITGELTPTAGTRMCDRRDRKCGDLLFDCATPFFSAVMLATGVLITCELTPTAGTRLIMILGILTILTLQSRALMTSLLTSVSRHTWMPFWLLVGVIIFGLVEFLALTNVEFVASGEYHTCGVSASGDLFTWGDGTHNAGILGHGTDMSHWIPKRVSGAIEGQQVLSVACGTWHSALATSDGKLFTFGDGKFGVLGHGDRENVMYPKEVQMLSGLKTVKVACGVWHTAAIVEVMCQSGANKSSRKLFTWGDGDKHRLGHGSKETYLLPTCVSSLIDYNFHQIACGQTITVALTTSGHVFTMGGTAYGQLGNPNSDGKLPCLVQEKLVGVEEISCGAYHVAVLTSRSEVFTWGRGANGRLGHGDIEDRKTPTLVEALRDMHVKNISCGLNFTSSICIHKWVSGPDQSVCAGCWQAFGFTKKRHNCYNCGMVHCHACSSKKAVKAALAQTPGKPHRVCDSCYAKLKAAEACNTSTVLEEKGDSSNNPLNDKTFVDSTVHDVEDVTEAETYAMVRNTVVSIGVSNVVGTNKEKSNSENIFSKDSTVLEVDEVNKVILDSNLGDFPPLQDSVMKKKGNEKGAKGDKSKGGFAGSKNRFDILNGVGSEGPKIVPEGMTRKPRAAVMGVANLLQEMKAKKKDNLEKIKGSCVDVANQSAWDIVGADYSAAVRTEPVKSFEIRSGKLGSKFHSTSLVRAAQVPSLLQLKDIAFPSSLTAIQSVFKPAAVSPPLSPPHLSPINSRSTSPYSSKPSPPRSSTSSFSKDVIESLRDQMNF
ncbi:hypothetical protein V6N11_036323 [Hibiscus sabdariffa]|uniref:FYVE-type domain-containing protein n=1 Tax=Hibiscus sabdariffa TaxID=183260 RepID=A0ABR2RA22_9ROSI